LQSAQSAKAKAMACAPEGRSSHQEVDKSVPRIGTRALARREGPPLERSGWRWQSDEMTDLIDHFNRDLMID
jgi:hypothetical protein